jgi:hypothetical protein
MQILRLALIAIILVLPVSANARSTAEQTIYVPGRESPLGARGEFDQAPADAALPCDWRRTDSHEDTGGLTCEENFRR